MSLALLVAAETSRAKHAQRKFQDSSGAPRPQATLPPPSGVKPTPHSRTDAALESLAAYIPTEVATLYVAALSAFDQLKALLEWLTKPHVYWTFVALTPVLLLILTLGRLKKEGLAIRIGKSLIFKMFAASVAFLVWGLAVPGNPYVAGSVAAVAGLFAMFVSIILASVAPFFDGD